MNADKNFARFPILAALVASIAVSAAAPAPAATNTAATPFCSKRTIESMPAAYTRGDHELCAGSFAAAARDLATLLTHYEADVGGGIDRPEFERRYILAEELTGRGDLALKLLQKIRPDAETLAYFRGNVCKAMRAYAADDATYDRTPDQIVDYKNHGGASPELKTTADAACAGDWELALKHMKLVNGDASTLYDLMLGALYARARDWPHAAAAWWNASGEYPDVIAMEEIDISQFQYDAEWMLYYYRAHLH